MNNSQRHKIIIFAFVLVMAIFWFWLLVGSAAAHYADTNGMRYTQDAEVKSQ